MSRRPVRAVLGSVVVLTCVAGVARAQQAAPPPFRPLGQITHVAPESLASIAAAVPVAGGRVYVNDILGRRLLLFDAGLTRGTVIADSTGSVEAYGNSPGTLLPFRGDSALFISPGTLSMLVLSPGGTVARVMATPPTGRGMGAVTFIGSIFGTPGLDARGRLVFYQPAMPDFRGMSAGGPVRLEPPDSAFVVRFDFASRVVDTVAAIRIPRTRTAVRSDESGRPSGFTMTAMPAATVDDWAVTSDGALAVVRGRDYHVEWLGADGAWAPTPRMAFAWERLDDAQKNALLDSTLSVLQAAMDSNYARQQRAAAAGGGAGGRDAAGATGQGGGGAVVVMTFRSEGSAAGGGGATRTVSMPRATVVRGELTDVPDYRPVFSQGAVRADAEGRLWVRTSKVEGGRPVYDIVSRQGAVVDRVQLPPNRTIAGFGPGVVYLGVRDSVGTVHLERARIQ